MADTECNPNHTITQLTHNEVLNLADRLYGRAVSRLSVDTPQQRRDLITASRALRRILSAFEARTGYQLHTIMLCGGQ